MFQVHALNTQLNGDFSSCHCYFTSSFSARGLYPISIAVAWTNAGKVSTRGMDKLEEEPGK